MQPNQAFFLFSSLFLNFIFCLSRPSSSICSHIFFWYFYTFVFDFRSLLHWHLFCGIVWVGIRVYFFNFQLNTTTHLLNKASFLIHLKYHIYGELNFNTYVSLLWTPYSTTIELFVTKLIPQFSLILFCRISLFFLLFLLLFLPTSPPFSSLLPFHLAKLV